MIKSKKKFNLEEVYSLRIISSVVVGRAADELGWCDDVQPIMTKLVVA